MTSLIEFRDDEFANQLRSPDLLMLFHLWNQLKIDDILPDEEIFMGAIETLYNERLFLLRPDANDEFQVEIVEAAFRKDQESKKQCAIRKPSVVEIDLIRDVAQRAFDRSKPDSYLCQGTEADTLKAWEHLILPLEGDQSSVILAMVPFEQETTMITSILDSAMEGFSAMRPVLDDDGKIIDLQIILVNDSTANIVDKPISELLGARLLKVFPKILEDGRWPGYVHAYETGEPCNFKITEDRAHDTITYRVAVSRYGGGLSVTLVDITAEEETLMQLASQHRELLERKDAYKAQAQEMAKLINKLRRAQEKLAAEIEERKALADTLRELANTDELTKLANRRAFMSQGKSEIQRAIRYDNPVSLIMFDLDHFKLVNDTYGHHAGDEVLRSVSQTALNSIRQSVDHVGRLGGEEFAILLPQTDVKGAWTVAERLRQSIEANPVTVDGRVITVTASLGIAKFCPGDNDLDDVLQRADEALYTAKNNGRNLVHPQPEGCDPNDVTTLDNNLLLNQAKRQA
ncbi:MAG: diguanylate cyclase [Cohaesibacteraceae bacterium]|nr:diguanylate cyclase [Cohaesibacteraceae bacterium]